MTNITSTQTLTVIVRSGNGTGEVAKTLTTNVTIAIPPKSSITYTGTLSLNIASTIVFTISPTPSSNANVKVYYDTISTSSSPTQCGTGTSIGNTATTRCTIQISGQYYLYISLDIDLDTISNSSSAGVIYPVNFSAMTAYPGTTIDVYGCVSGGTYSGYGVGVVYNNGQEWKSPPFTNSGYVRHHLVSTIPIKGDFTLIIQLSTSGASYNPIQALGWGTSISPSNFKANNNNFTSVGDLTPCVTVSGAYILENSNNGSNGGYYKYFRSGGSTYLYSSSSVAGPWSLFRTVSANATNDMFCMIGHNTCASASQYISKIISFTSP